MLQAMKVLQKKFLRFLHIDLLLNQLTKKYLKNIFLVQLKLFVAYLCIIDISIIKFIINYLLKILYISAVRKELHTLLLKMEKKSVMKN